MTVARWVYLRAIGALSRGGLRASPLVFSFRISASYLDDLTIRRVYVIMRLRARARFVRVRVGEITLTRSIV